MRELTSYLEQFISRLGMSYENVNHAGVVRHGRVFDDFPQEFS